MKEEKNKEINFEESMRKLEELANELEKGDLDLDTSVNKFEEGMELSKNCSQMLKDAEKRITILLENDDELKEEAFDPSIS